MNLPALKVRQRTNRFESLATTLYFSRALFQDWQFHLEGTFLNGDSGLLVKEGNEVKLSGYGFAGEIVYRDRNRESMKDYKGYSGKLKFGLATGDDPDTDTYEAFAFDPNYNLGLLLFNHPLGTYNLFQNSLYRYKAGSSSDSHSGTQSESGEEDDSDSSRGGSNANGGVENSARWRVDEDRIGNAFYLAPEVSYGALNKGLFTYRLIYASLQKTEFLDREGELFTTSKDLGLEFDVEFRYAFQPQVQFFRAAGFFVSGESL